jgi:hypothetical protein
MYGRSACSAIDGESIGLLLNLSQTILFADRQMVFGNINGLNQTISLDRVSSFYLFDRNTLKSDRVKHATGLWLAVRGCSFNN